MYVTISTSGSGSGSNGNPCPPSFKIYPNLIKGGNLQMRVAYPINPCNPNMRISNQFIKIYDFNGEKVYETFINLVEKDGDGKDIPTIMKEEISLTDIKLNPDKYILVFDDGKNIQKEILIVE